MCCARTCTGAIYSTAPSATRIGPPNSPRMGLSPLKRRERSAAPAMRNVLACAVRRRVCWLLRAQGTLPDAQRAGAAGPGRHGGGAGVAVAAHLRRGCARSACSLSCASALTLGAAPSCRRCHVRKRAAVPRAAAAAGGRGRHARGRCAAPHHGARHTNVRAANACLHARLVALTRARACAAASAGCACCCGWSALPLPSRRRTKPSHTPARRGCQTAARVRRCLRRTASRRRCRR